MIKGFPARFETHRRRPSGGGGGLAGTLAELVLYDLPADYFTTYRDKVEAVTQADVHRVARKYLDPGRMAILIVGDRAKVEPAIKDLPFAKVINILDTEGNPVAASPKADAVELTLRDRRRRPAPPHRAGPVAFEGRRSPLRPRG